MSAPPSSPVLQYPAPADPLSPRSTSSILATHPGLSSDQLRDIAEGLVSTIRIREQRYQASLDDIREELELVNDRVTTNTREYHTAPEGFEANNGRLPHFTIPVDEGVTQVAHWIQLLHDGRAAGYLAEDNPSSNPYVTELYARPTHPTAGMGDAIPVWFRRLLHGSSHQFRQLRDAARQHDADWGIYADIIRYRELDEQSSWLRDELDVVSSELRAATEARTACEDRLVAAQAADLFAHLPHARGLQDNDENGPRSGQRRRRRGNYGTRGRVN